ncbi:T9SS type A sorting domain-containing protein [Runella sp. MFBS21]|uniref:T9SS type A sorting domain-containing protein n=1 Tax=Runella sp. MFBS21 TaxID=3034018 RepID=UPI0023F8416A|nr:T9SS type A sorting domain-containing protein [Runella sp. MFBS21]MDF7819570.1 T9SS type A sorting domain-containing protein [Runella sp. MFBS21]
MKKIYLFVLFLGVLFKAASQGGGILQTFDGAAALPTGWSTTATSNALVENASNSNGYTIPTTNPTVSASGTNNLSMRNCGSATVSITTVAFDLTGKSNVIVGFGRRRTSTFAPTVSFSVSVDGGTTFSTLNSDVSSAANTTWAFLGPISVPTAANQASVIFRFDYVSTSSTSCTGSSANFRIDDFIVGWNDVFPVKLTFFKAEARSTGVELSWQTSEEISNQRFEIERSLDAKSFEKIGAIEGKGTISIAQNYSFLDSSPLQGLNYYRLKQVDFDGKYSYSVIRDIRAKGEESSFRVYPNPATNELKIEVPQQEEISYGELLDLTGRIVKRYGAGSDKVSIGDIRPGVYILKIKTQTGARYQQRIIKIN